MTFPLLLLVTGESTDPSPPAGIPDTRIQKHITALKLGPLGEVECLNYGLGDWPVSQVVHCIPIWQVVDMVTGRAPGRSSAG
jgi:hypothetical protein